MTQHDWTSPARPLCLQVLLQAGARLDMKDADGCLPLHLAAQFGNLGTVRALLAAGARPDCRADDGRTPVCVVPHLYWHAILRGALRCSNQS